MLLLLSGSTGAGKTAVGSALPSLVEGLAFHDADEIPVPDAHSRLAALDAWVERALTYERRGTDMILAAQSPLGELLTCPMAIEVEAIAACVLDCDDPIRMARIAGRHGPHEGVPGMDVLCWAAFHRMHAHDPRWEQGVLCEAAPERAWERWGGWRSDDPRWRVPVFDTSEVSAEETAEEVAAWIVRSRSDPPLRRDARWWLEPSPEDRVL